MLDHRGQFLGAALGFAGLPGPSYDRSLHALRTWLDSWAGIGAGMEHSPTRATGTGWERTPWHATQRAAWEALKKAETS
jgi:hypothetical protein